MRKKLSLSEKRRALAAKKKSRKLTGIGGNPSSPSETDMKSLFNHYQNGNNDYAEKLALSFTQTYPDHPFSWKILGSIYSKRGNDDQAAMANSRAAQLSPKDFEAHFNLGNALRRIGKLDQALLSYEQAIELKRDSVEAHNNLGNTLNQIEKFDDAKISFRRAIELKPGYFEAHCNLGSVLLRQGSYDEAEVCLRKAIEINPGYAIAYNHLGSIFQARGNLDDAEACYKKAIELHPDFFQAHNNQGVTQQAQNKFKAAEASYRKAIELKPDLAEAHCNLGNIFYELRRSENSEASYAKAIAIQPNFAEAHCNLGISLQGQGKFDAAKECFIRAISLKPAYAEAHRHLASLKEFDPYDEQYKNMQDLYLDETISQDQRCQINFSLAKACGDMGDFKQAFAHYCEGNALRKTFLDYDIGQDIELFEQLKSSYTFLAENALGSENLAGQTNIPKPVFIVGMPRSGTTLVEQIISNHQLVTGAGELPFIEEFGASLANGSITINKNAMLSFRKKYIAELLNLSDDKSVVTDKMPQNFRFIGLATAAFPEAKIVHVQRNPAAVCWANFKQYFTSKKLGFCYELSDITKYYELYKDLMAFWIESIPNRIYDLDYELLTTSQERETRKLIQYLELDWDDACLYPQDNKRIVATASDTQVRRKVYQGSSRDWQVFRPFLNGSLDQLDQSPN